jgi:hypothetical protein
MSQHERVLYEKIGDEFVPIGISYETERTSIYPKGQATLVVVDDGCTSWRYNVEPAIAPLAAAAILMEGDLCTIFYDACKPRLEDQQPDKKIKYTKKQKAAWDAMCDEMKFTTVSLPSPRAASERILEKIKARAVELMKDKDVLEQYEQFLTIATLKQK